MKKILILVLLIISISCKNEKTKTKKQTNSISGKIIGLNNKTLIKLDSTSLDLSKFQFDSVKTRKDSFKFIVPKLNFPKKMSLSFYNDSLKQINFIDFWIDSTDINISGKLNDLANIKITGCDLNKINKEYINLIAKLNTLELNKAFKSAKTPSEIKKLMEKANNLINSYRTKFIFENPNNIVSLDNVLGLKNFISKDSLKFYYEKLNIGLQNSSRGKLLKAFLETKKLNVGDTIQDFSAFDLNGKIVKLSDFKGKIILLDFWASWCGPCHQQNQQEYSRIYSRFKSKNFTIISYSLDKKSAKEAWENASKSDKIEWVNISNLKGFQDPLSEQFNINLLPTSFLINSNGVIIKSFTSFDPKNPKIEKEIEKLIQ